MQELPRKSSLRAPLSCAAEITLVWIRRLSVKNSTGKSLLALIPPTLAAAKITMSGFSFPKNSATARESERSTSARPRFSKFENPADSSARAIALPTMPLWPATKILSDFCIETISIFFFRGLRNPHFVRAKSASAAQPRHKPGRLQVQKTYKLFIGGKFVRGENGRVLAARGKGNAHLANFCRASKKDFRDAVVAARSAFPNWSKQSAYLRGQILYRAAEMLETRRAELQNEIARSNNSSRSTSGSETTLAIDRLVHFAGWTDKFSQVFGTVNPVASSHFNFTTPEPTGVVAVICPDEPPLLAFVSMVIPVILSGNCAVVLVSTTKPLAALTFSEIIATSDLPPGVINVLAGDRAELAPHIAAHMDVNAIVDGSGDEEIGRALQRGGALNVKRHFGGTWRRPAGRNPRRRTHIGFSTR